MLHAALPAFEVHVVIDGAPLHQLLPPLEVTDSAGARLASNDNGNAALAPTFAHVGALPLPAGSKDAAFVVTLTAGRSYTVQVSGVANAVGEAPRRSLRSAVSASPCSPQAP